LLVDLVPACLALAFRSRVRLVPYSFGTFPLASR
jgi:hypothetical protein